MLICYKKLKAIFFLIKKLEVRLFEKPWCWIWAHFSFSNIWWGQFGLIQAPSSIWIEFLKFYWFAYLGPLLTPLWMFSMRRGSTSLDLQARFALIALVYLPSLIWIMAWVMACPWACLTWAHLWSWACDGPQKSNPERKPNGPNCISVHSFCSTMKT